VDVKSSLISNSFLVREV